MIGLYMLAFLFMFIVPVVLVGAAMYAVVNVYYLCTRRRDGTQEDRSRNL